MANQQAFQVISGDLITSTSSVYSVQRVLGSGSFGVVARCYKHATKKTVALKIIKDKRDMKLAKMEDKTLRRMKELNSDQLNIVSWNDSFTYRGHYCLEFELLDMNLYEFMLIQQVKSLELKKIRPIMHQLATALQFLKSMGIVHADLKPENVMMVDHVQKPLKIKVTDFGLAHKNSEARMGQPIQSLFYRAPEVLLGTPYSEAIDVWSLGCIGAELLMGVPLFPGLNTYDMMRHQVYTVGKPPEDLLNVGMYTKQFFDKSCTFLWRFMSPFEAGVLTYSPRTIRNLNDLLKGSRKLSKEDARADSRDRNSFVNFLTNMLRPDASKRITPSQMLQHPFITMNHFDGMLNNLHVKSCIEVMGSCQGSKSGDDQDVAQDEKEKENQVVAQEETYSSTTGLDAHHDPTLTSKERRNFPNPALPVRHWQRNPPKSPVQRRQIGKARSFIALEDKSQAKMSLKLKKELLQKTLKKAAQSSLTQVSHGNKSKRADDEQKEKEKVNQVVTEEEAYSSTTGLAAHHDPILTRKKEKKFPIAALPDRARQLNPLKSRVQRRQSEYLNQEQPSPA